MNLSMSFKRPTCQVGCSFRTLSSLSSLSSLSACEVWGDEPSDFEKQAYEDAYKEALEKGPEWAQESFRRPFLMGCVQDAYAAVAYGQPPDSHFSKE